MPGYVSNVSSIVLGNLFSSQIQLSANVMNADSPSNATRETQEPSNHGIATAESSGFSTMRRIHVVPRGHEYCLPQAVRFPFTVWHLVASGNGKDLVLVEADTVRVKVMTKWF